MKHWAILFFAFVCTLWCCDSGQELNETKAEYFRIEQELYSAMPETGYIVLSKDSLKVFASFMLDYYILRASNAIISEIDSMNIFLLSEDMALSINDWSGQGNYRIVYGKNGGPAPEGWSFKNFSTYDCRKLDNNKTLEIRRSAKTDGYLIEEVLK